MKVLPLNSQEGGVVISHADITGRTRAEVAFRSSEEKFRQFFAHTPGYCYIISPEGNILDVNNAALQALGYERGELVGKPVETIYAPESLSKTKELFARWRKTGQIINEEMVITSKNGDKRTVLLTVGGVRDKEGSIMHSTSIQTDITELKRSQEILSEIQRISHLGSWEWNIVTNNLAWSDEIYRIFGLQPQEFGATYDAFLDAVHPDDRQAVMQAVNDSLADPQKPYSIQHRIVRGDGSERIVHERGEITFDTEGRPARMVGTVHDITEHKEAENELRQAYAEIKKLKDQLEMENVYLKQEMKMRYEFEPIVGQSEGIKSVLYKIEQVAPTDSLVLITGETGTGKGLIAEAIHKLSTRKQRAMVKVNCASLPSGLIESELFGREKGAYTGALTRQAGRFEVADGSSIFLDEIGALWPEVQAKLLRVLQEGEFERLGNPKTIRVNVRVIAATNCDLYEEVQRGNFREDLYYRLNVFPIEVPPLRERVEDIPLLVWAFIHEFTGKMGKKIQSVPKKTMEALQRYPWPGNVRELRNIIEHAIILSLGETLNVRLPEESGRVSTKTPTLKEAEYHQITKTLEITGWRIKGRHGAAERLGLKPSTLYTKMKALGIPTRRNKDGIPT